MRNSIRISAIFLASAAGGLCQTRINLQAQSQNVDFSAADSTRSFKSGPTLPMECAVGETFFKTAAPAGQNFYACTAPNTWTLESGGGGGRSQDLTDLKVTATSGTVLAVAGGAFRIDSSTFSLSPVTITIRSFGVQAVGAANPATVTLTEDVVGVVRNGDTVNISGVNGSGCGMFNGTFTVLVTGTRQLTLANVNGSGCSYSGGGTVAGTGNGTAYVYANGSGSVTLEVPASSGVIASCAGSCMVNQVVVPAMAVNGLPLATVAISTGAWNSVTDKRSFMSTRQISVGTGLSISDSGGGSTLAIDTALVPQLGGSNTWTGSNDLSGASRTASFKSGTTAPGSCTVGDTFFDTDAAAGSNFLGCTATNTWTVQGGGSGGGLGSATYSDVVSLWTTCSGYLKSDGTCSTPVPATGMTQATANNTDNTISKSVGTGGRAFEKTGVTIDDSNNLVVPGTITSGTSGGGEVELSGSSSGSVTVKVPATAGTTTVQLAAQSGTLTPKRSFTVLLTGSGTAGVLTDTDDQPAVFYNSLGQGVTITGVSCKTDSATATRIQLQRDDGSPANILTDNTGAGLDCSSTRASGALDSTEEHIASTSGIDFVMVTAGGAGKWVSVTVTYVLD